MRSFAILSLVGALSFSPEASSAADPPSGGDQVPGDCNQNGSLEIGDATCVLGVLFLGSPGSFPCGEGRASDVGNLALLDWQPDGAIDISDGIAILQFLFIGGPAHPRAVPGQEVKSCVPIEGCGSQGACPVKCVPPPSACPEEAPPDLQEAEFVRGDVNQDGTVNITDSIYMLSWLCLEGPEPPCLDAADTNDDGCVDLQDAYLYPGACPWLGLDFCEPLSPYPACGSDPNPDFLGCKSAPRCSEDG